jgi:hypothetical protein
MVIVGIRITSADDGSKPEYRGLQHSIKESTHMLDVSAEIHMQSSDTSIRLLSIN